MTSALKLTRDNAAVVHLEGWLRQEQERVRLRLEEESSMETILRLQGRATLVREMLRSVDPAHLRYGESPSDRM